MSNSSKRVSKAEVELNKAYERLLKNADTTKLIMEGLADISQIEEILTKFKSNEKWTEAEKRKWGKIFGAGTIGFNALKNSNSGYDGLTVLSEAGVDVGAVFTENFVEKKILAKLCLKFVPVVGWISTGIDIFNLVNQAAGKDEISISEFIKKKLEELRGTTTDLPDLEMLKKGILKITMHDGTVYERPLVDIAGSYMLTGNSKSDVLFGSKGNDMLIGHGGSDILIGGSGKDDYFVDNGDTIKDSDGKGRVFLSSTNIQLTGGTQIEKDSKIYKGKDGTKYELKGSDLIINDNITIENFSKISNDLGIVLVDVDDIVVTIGNNQSTEGGNGKHSMEFKITLNRALKKDEFLELIINGQRVKFKEGDIEQTYTHTWDGNTIKEEDRKFEVSGIVMQTSENLNVQAVVSGQGLIKDDDQDNDPDPEREYSPIVIDLGNDGINSHALNYTINFDLDNNGFKEATGWVSGDDALLAIDKNNR
ncbi:MAG: calcium-binding protein [Campylobacter sp.]